MCLWLLFLKNLFERERGEEWETLAYFASTSTHNSGMCPYQDWDPPPLGIRNDTPTNWAPLVRALLLSLIADGDWFNIKKVMCLLISMGNMRLLWVDITTWSNVLALSLISCYMIMIQRGGFTRIKCLISLTIYYNPPNNQNTFLELNSLWCTCFSRKHSLVPFSETKSWGKRNWLVQSAQYQFMFTTNIPQILI